MPKTDEYEPELVLDDVRNDGKPFYLSDDGHGTMIAWDTCHRYSGGCGNSIMHCTCKSGPVEPGYIRRWREEALGVVRDVVKRATTPVREALSKARTERQAASAPTMSQFIDQEVIDRVKAAKESRDEPDA